MMQLDALDLQNRLRGEKPVVVVIARKRNAASEKAIAQFAHAAREEQIDAVSFDADQPHHAPFLDELRVRHVPEVLVLQRGVVLERTPGARDHDDARSLLRAALRRR
jgi:hypothetical protein